MKPKIKLLFASLFLVMTITGIEGLTVSFALTLQEAKAKGLVGEMPTGYLGLVPPSTSSEVQSLIKEINEKRKAKYQEIARKNKTQLSSVEALAGKTAIEKTKPSHYIKLPSGEWMKK